MRINYYAALAAVAAILCGLNFIFFDYIYKGALATQHPLFLSALLTALLFLIFVGLLFLLAPPRAFKFTAALLIAIASISAYFMREYGVILDIDMLLNLFATDTKEAFSYINFGLILWMILGVILPVCVICALKINYKKGTKRAFIRAFLGFFGALAIVLVAIYLNSQTIVPFFRDNNLARKLHVPLYPIYSMVKAVNALFEKPAELDPIATGTTRTRKDEPPKLLVVVVGETARSKNYQALGYATNATNAYTMEFVKRGSAVYFEASSCGTATLVSLPCMFAHTPRSEYSGKLYAHNAVDFLAISGVKTRWIGNNTGNCKGVCARIESENLGAEFDTAMLEKAFDFIADSARQRADSALFLHLQGSHGPTYYQRYPKDFAKFTPTCDTSELAKCDEHALINTYDNTILFTDFFIAQLLAQLEKLDGVEASLLYVSDHGESLGENGIYLHGLPYSIAPEAQKRVPLMFYSASKERLSRLKQDLPLSHDNIFHTLLGFFNVESGYYDSELDMFK